MGMYTIIKYEFDLNGYKANTVWLVVLFSIL